MRIAESQIYDSVTKHSLSARNRVFEANEQLSSGLRINHAWTDAADSGRAVRLEAAASQAKSISSSVQHSKDELVLVEATLSSSVDAMMRARELTMQYANDTYSPSDRALGAVEVQGLLSTVVSSLNVQFGDHYVFGGFQDQTAPFDAVGNYNGDANQKRVEIAPGVYEAVSVRADEAFKGTAGGVDVFQVLTDLQAALNANDTAAIRSALTGIDSSLDQISAARTIAGSTINTLEMASDAFARIRDESTTSAARLTDMDLIVGSSKMAEAQNALNATLTSGAKTFELSLMDRLR
ncbi:MAG: hypothetical protein GY822_28105 [Deltaproteobacteria bacterium]|nr:hypothetical protein [Deltaproteobacteria bacterium]